MSPVARKLAVAGLVLFLGSCVSIGAASADVGEINSVVRQALIHYGLIDASGSPIAGGWTGTATSDLDMDGFNITNPGQVFVGSGGRFITAGSASPEGVIIAPVASLYLRTGGSAGTVLYMKESGSGNTGWVAYSGTTATPTLAAVLAQGSVADRGISWATGLGGGTYLSGATDQPFQIAGGGTQPVVIASVCSAAVSSPVIDYSSATTLTLTEAQCKGQTWRLTGSALQTVNIPDAGASIGTGEEGLVVTFICENTAGVKLQFGTGDTCTQPGLGATASAGYLYSKWSGSEITVTRTAAATFVGGQIVGTWGKDSTTTAGFAFTPTDWSSFSYSTGGWVDSNHTTAGKLRQVGDSLQIMYTVALTGAPTTATVTFPMPSGYTADETKMAGDTFMCVGHATASDSSTGSLFPIHTVYDLSANLIRVYVTAGTSQVTQAQPMTWATGDRLDVTATVPVQ